MGMTSVFTPAESAEGFKRETYLLGLPLGVLFFLSAWFLESPMARMVAFDAVARPLVASFFVALSILLYFKKLSTRAVEASLIVCVYAYFLARLSLLLLFDHSINHGTADIARELGEFGYWFPILYGLAFFMFGVRRGKGVSLVFFGATFAVGLIHGANRFALGESLGDLRPLGQVYVSSGLLILIFNAFAKLTEIHTGLASTMSYLANTDGLTRVSNRRHLEVLLEEEEKRAARYGNPFCVLLLDIDHFKRVNDALGHDVGDEVLREMADLLFTSVRSVDHVGRWGGEEFLIILPEVGLEEARTSAVRLKGLIEAHGFEPAGTITASFGVAEFSRGEGLDVLIKRADAALYGAKQEGRNKVRTDADDAPALLPGHLN